MWFHEYGPWHFQKIAEHYGIYKDLFDGDFFVPVVNIDINYEFDGQYINPVIRGNRLTPTEVAFIVLAIILFWYFSINLCFYQVCKQPQVSFEAPEGSHWTLIMTNPDGHLKDNESEYLHWLM
jgi:large subunit ribosomal protein L38